MARYNVEFTVTANNIVSLKKMIAAAFPGEEWRVEKIDLSPSRSSRLSDAEQHFETAKSIVEELKDEMENWKDSIPENLQDGDKASEVNWAFDALEEIFGNMDQVDFSVDFPTAF